MTVQSDIRLAMAGILDAIPNIGMVYDHYKYSSDWSKFLDQFTISIGGNRQVRGWWLSIPTISVPQSQYQTFGSDGDVDTYNWPLRGVMTFSDANGSETEFEDLIHLVRNTLRHQLTLGLPSEIVPGAINVVVPLIDIRSFGSYLVHYCEMSVTMDVMLPATVWGP